VGPGLAENWTETGGDPFAATLKDGKIFGLGSADVKIDFLCKLYAIEKFRERKLKMPIYLVGTCGEELGMFGARYLIKSGALNPRFVVVGEPSDMRVVYAHKSLNLFRVSVGYHMISRDARGFNRRIDLHSFGKSAHGSYPHLGVNAILGMTDFIQRAADNGFETRFTRLDGGETVNKVPDRASAQFYLTSHQFEDFKRFFREVVKADGKEKAFRVELGGVGDAGVRFLPETIFPCLAEVIAFFRSVAADFEKVKDASYNPAHSTVNFGKLRQGMSGIDLHFDLRLLPDLMADEIEKHIQKGVGAIAARYPGLNVAAVRERMNPGLGMKLEDELVRACGDALKAAGLEPLLDKKATSTEAAQYFQAGYEAVVFGPGKSLGNSHSPNEHNLVDQVEKATAFYERLIERVCT
jgi:acetylornithine deacetylase/succinyl-diaminopimelate desuccinylase-like protein